MDEEEFETATPQPHAYRFNPWALVVFLMQILVGFARGVHGACEGLEEDVMAAHNWRVQQRKSADSAREEIEQIVATDG